MVEHDDVSHLVSYSIKTEPPGSLLTKALDGGGGVNDHRVR
jgi:hypothetical protein